MHELSEKLLNFITKDGKCSNLEKLLSNVEDAKELVNTPMDPEGFIYPIHIVAIRAKDVDLDRKLTILIKNGADIKHKYGSNGLTVAHLLCMRKNPTLGLNILHEACEGEINFKEFIDGHGNTLLHALANPKEAKCTDGLKLMETVQFLCHRNLDFKAKNNQGKSFLDLVTAKDARPIVKKYIAHDFLSELENDDRKCAEHSGQNPREKLKCQSSIYKKEFAKKCSKELIKLGDDFFSNFEEYTNLRNRELILKIIKQIDAGLNQGKVNQNQPNNSISAYNEGEKIVTFLHDPPSQREIETGSKWEDHLEGILNEIRAAPSIKSKEIVTPTSDKLFMLYHICKKKMDLWHKTIQKDHYHWVPKGEDPLDTKWSQKRRIPNFGNWFSEEIGNEKDKEDEFDGWYYRNGTPLSSSIPAYFVKP
jgi:hypothetical protein